MKKILFLVLTWSVLLGAVSYAGEYQHKKKVVKKYYNTTNVTNVTQAEYKNEFGAKLDAPNLVELRKNWYLGVEASKDLYHTDAEEGWTSFAKISYTGTWFSFVKSEDTK